MFPSTRVSKYRIAPRLHGDEGGARLCHRHYPIGNPLGMSAPIPSSMLGYMIVLNQGLIPNPFCIHALFRRAIAIPYLRESTIFLRRGSFTNFANMMQSRSLQLRLIKTLLQHGTLATLVKDRLYWQKILAFANATEEDFISYRF